MNKPFALLAFSIIVICFALPIWLQYSYYGTVFLSDIKAQGALGPVSDWISGIITPCVALASFFLLYVTYISQKEELQLTRLAMKDQNSTLSRQRFENTFFNLLSLHHNIKENLEYEMIQKNQGPDFFSYMYSRLEHNYNNEKDKNRHDQRLDKMLVEVDTLIGSYTSLNQFLLSFNQYYNSLSQILKLIYMSKLEIDEKVYFVSLVRSHLSIYEFTLSFYHSFLGNNKKDFDMIYELGIFRTGDFSKLFDMSHIELAAKSYSKNASNLLPLE